MVLNHSVLLPCRLFLPALPRNGSPEGSKAPENVKAQAAFQCAPSVFIPGTQKGASTFIFHAISWHPQVVVKGSFMI